MYDLHPADLQNEIITKSLKLACEYVGALVRAPIVSHTVCISFLLLFFCFLFYYFFASRCCLVVGGDVTGAHSSGCSGQAEREVHCV